MSVKTGSQALDEYLSQQVEGSTVILSGQLSSYYLMQIAQATVASESEVHKVKNHLVISHEM